MIKCINEGINECMKCDSFYLYRCIHRHRRHLPLDLHLHLSIRFIFIVVSIAVVAIVIGLMCKGDLNLDCVLPGTSSAFSGQAATRFH